MKPQATLDCVIDASVGVKLFLVEPLSDAAHALFTRLTTDPPARFYTPDLFYIECANTFWKAVHRWGLAPEEAQQFIGQAGLLALTAVSTASLMASAFDIALAYRITAYDAAYVALARQLNLPLITADVRLARALTQMCYSYDVRWLGDLLD